VNQDVTALHTTSRANAHRADFMDAIVQEQLLAIVTSG
jgi:hypothetical protein